MSKISSFIKYWLLPLGWMSLIFVGSSDSHSYQHSSRFIVPFLHWLFPHMTEEHIDAIHYFIRKCAHFTEYAALSLLLWRALRQPIRNDTRPWRWNEAGLAILIVFLYAATDEFHQRYVPTRTPHFTDVLIDTFGAAAAMFALWVLGQSLNWWPKTKIPKIQEAI